MALLCASLACSVREPLDSAGATEEGSSSGPGGSSTGPDDEPVPSPTSSTGPATTTGPSDTTETVETTLLSEPTSDTTTGEGVLRLESLLAVSTVIAPDLPFQFVATSTWFGFPEPHTLRLELQPLALGQGQVLTPRTPVGEPIVIEAIPVVDGNFEIELAMHLVTGMANPVTGGDVVATLLLRGRLMGSDFYCGQVDGDIISPLEASLVGSTFAALEMDGDAFPPAVMVDCDGKTVG